jgi:GT2 family glycosyltransferase
MCKVSVVIITKELDSKINETLKSLLNQNFENYEIIIVCHKNSLKTLSMADVPIKVIEHPGTSRGMARNIGVANSSGGVIAFIDDDCSSNEEWLRNGCETLFENGEIGVVGGRVRVHEGLPEFSQIALSIISIPFINGWSVTFSNFQNKREVSYVPTCNAFFRKEVLEKTGGFMDTNYCEDVEICSRVRRFGYKVVYDPKVEVRHRWNIWNWRSFIKHFYNYGKGRGRAMIEYPHISNVNLSPLIALMSLLIFVPLVILKPLLLIFILMLFTFFIIFCSLYAYHRFKRRKYMIFTPIVMVLMYLSYITGLLRGILGWRGR